MLEASFPCAGLLNIVLHISLFSALFVFHCSLFSCSTYNLQSKYFEAIGFLFFFSWGGASSLNSSPSQLMSRCRHFHKQTKPILFLFSQAVVQIFSWSFGVQPRRDGNCPPQQSSSGNAVLCLLKAAIVFTNKQKIKQSFGYRSVGFNSSALLFVRSYCCLHNAMELPSGGQPLSAET